MLTSIFCLIIVALTNFFIDPFQHYRKSNWYSIVYTNELYLNPGIAKNFNYDSIVLGTSMTENFVLSDINETLSFQKPIKLCIAGAKIKAINTIANVAFDSGQVKNVLYGLDVFQFAGKIQSESNEAASYPYYLYDNNFLNDYQYLFNIDILMESARPFIFKYTKPANHPAVNFNEMYSNQHYRVKNPSERHAISDYYNRALAQKPVLEDYAYMTFVENFELSFLPLIKNNPNIDFYIFYPPYSILQFVDIQNETWLNDALEFKAYIYKQLKKYKNVKMYDFQIATQLTHDLKRYRDISHYHKDINRWILEQIKGNNYRLISAEQVQGNNKQIEKELEEYTVPRLDLD